MSEPYWSALGGGGAVDYKGTWAAGTAYLPGDVVIYNGVTYLAVNPSTAQTPPAAPATFTTVPRGASLPASPTDGQEAILVDSLTVPTYAWRFRYDAGITDAYKWVFVGGGDAGARVGTLESPGSASAWVDLATVGPRIPNLRAGLYTAHAIAQVQGISGDYLTQICIVAGSGYSVLEPTARMAWNAAYGTQPVFGTLLTVTAGSDIRLRYWAANVNVQFANRALLVTPVRVA